MATVIDVSALTLNPEEVRTVGEVIFERVFEDGEIAEYHDVESGIDMQTQIVLQVK